MNDSPRVSIVVTTRNDGHGGTLLRRMQIFVDGLLEQSRRHGLRLGGIRNWRCFPSIWILSSAR